MSDITTKNQKKIIISIDYGTHSSGFGYTLVNDPQKNIVLYNSWDGITTPYFKTLSAILYKKKSVLSIGHQAIKDYMEADDDERKNMGLLNFVKKDFQKDPNGILKINEMLTKSASLVVADYLRLLFQILKENLEKVGIKYNLKNVRFVISVPANYTDHLKMEMKKVLVKAGILLNEKVDENDCIFVMENEASAIRCLEYMKKEMNEKDFNGKSILIVDAGGGTVDVSTHKIEKGKLKEINKRGGNNKGSSTLDENFISFLNNEIGTSSLDSFKKEFPKMFLKFIKGWEKTKVSILSTSKKIYIDWPAKLKQSNNILKLKGYINEDEELVLDKKALEKIFKDPVDATIELIEEQIKSLEEKGGQINYIFVVGGFGQSGILISEIKSKFEKECDKIITPRYSGDAVLVGSVLLGLDCSLIRSRVSLNTYGISVNAPFIDGVHNEDYFIPKGNLCKNVFHHLVYSGEEVPEDHEIEEIYKIQDKTKKICSIDFFISKSKYPLYVNDKGIYELGKIECKVNPDKENNEIKVIYQFGKGFLNIKAYNDQGEVTEGALEFSSKTPYGE